MRCLSKPNLILSSKGIFELCANSYKDKDLVNGLLECADQVRIDSECFAQDFPKGATRIEGIKNYPKGVSKKHFVDLYNSKFASKQSPGRLFYDLILSSPKDKICPICGDRQVTNLDHYMPESIYTSLVVSPDNLVPICRDCNYNKLRYHFEKDDNALLHPYFDKVNQEAWLEVNLKPDIIVEFYVKCPDGWPEQLKGRLNNHIQVYKLLPFYEIKASQEIEDEKVLWTKVLNDAGPDKLFDTLVDAKTSKEINHINSWRAALYRGLVTDFETVLMWLTPPTPRPVDPTTTSTDV